MDTLMGCQLHNHTAPAEWKIDPNVLEDISNTAIKNTSITPKELQKGKGMLSMLKSNAVHHSYNLRDMHTPNDNCKGLKV